MSTIPAWVRVGAEVICVVALWHRNDAQRRWLPNLPQLNQIYTIRKVVKSDRGVVGVLLNEVVNPVGVLSGYESGFEIEKFRPVTKRTAEQDIAEHFADLLKVGAPEQVQA